MKPLLLRILLGLTAGTAMFWIFRFGGWIDSLTTLRTPFYCTLNHIGAWMMAGFVFLAVMANPKQ
jgi:hypothetical protein